MPCRAGALGHRRIEVAKEVDDRLVASVHLCGIALAGECATHGRHRRLEPGLVSERDAQDIGDHTERKRPSEVGHEVPRPVPLHSVEQGSCAITDQALVLASASGGEDPSEVRADLVMAFAVEARHESSEQPEERSVRGRHRRGSSRPVAQHRFDDVIPTTHRWMDLHRLLGIVAAARGEEGVHQLPICPRALIRGPLHHREPIPRDIGPGLRSGGHTSGPDRAPQGVRQRAVHGLACYCSVCR